MRARQDNAPPPRPLMRLDKWLVQARFFKTRGLSAEVVSSGHVRVNGIRSVKPAQTVGPGDTLVFPQGNRIRMVRILGLTVRRGPAAEAQELYDDLDPALRDAAGAKDIPSARAGGA